MSDLSWRTGLWFRLAALALPRAHRRDALLALRELYDLRAHSVGTAAAAAWLRREVLTFLCRVPLERLRTLFAQRLGRLREDLVIDLRKDFTVALRGFRQEPGFAVVAILALTLGIGANAVIFTLVDHVVLRPLPYPNAERIAAVWPESFMLRGEFALMREQARSVERIAAYLEVAGFNLELADRTQRVSGVLVSSDFLEILGNEPLLGRVLTPEDSSPSVAPVAMISENLWRNDFAGDPSILDRSVRIDGLSRRIVGVLPGTLAFPRAGQQLLLPLDLDPAAAGVFWGSGGLRTIAVLAPGVTFAAAQGEMLDLSLRMRELNPLWTPPEDFRASNTVRPLQEIVVGDVRTTLLLLLSAVAMVLVVACGNVATLLLARGLARRHDLSVRAALGARRGRLVRQGLVESVLLAAIGCAVALAAAHLTLGFILTLLPDEIPRARAIGLDARVVTAGALLALAVGVVSGAAPALRNARADAAAALRDSGRTSSVSLGSRRLSRLMVVGQFAGAVVLIVGAGLLIRSLGALADVETGYAIDSTASARVTLAGAHYEEPATRLEFFDELAARARALPGVEAAGIGTRVPFGQGRAAIATFIEDVTLDPNSLPVVWRTAIRPGYFEALRLPLNEGRRFDLSDEADAALVAIVDEAFVERFWPGESSLGRRIRYPWRGAPWLEIVGVVGSVADHDIAAQRQPSFYVPLSQTPSLAVDLVVRTARPDPEILGALARVVRDVDRSVPVSQLTPLRDLVSGSLAQARWTTMLLGAFALMALLLGCLGIYGVVAYSVRQQTRDLGVQLALGASASRIRRGVLGEGLRMLVPGAVLGLGLALPLARFLDSQLYGVSAADPLTLATVPVVLGIAGLGAVYIPAARATRVDPIRSLRA